MKRSFKKNIYENQVERNKAWANNLHLYEKNQAFLDEKYCLDSKQQIFDEIQIGEVIYAKMPFSAEKMEKIPPLHRQRPYIVVGKRKDALIAYPSSHKMPNHQEEDYIFRIHSTLNKYYHRSGEIFRSWTDSHYDLKKAHFIPIENMIEVFQIPEYSDIQRLERQLILLKNRGKRVFLMDIVFPIREGDILRFEKAEYANKSVSDRYEYYYVYSSYKEEIYAHCILPVQDSSTGLDRNKLRKKLSDDIEITIGEQRYSILTQTQKKLKAFDCKKLVLSATQKEVEQINTLKKQLKQAQKEWKNKEKTLKQIRFYFAPGTILYFRYGYEKYIYLYSHKNTFYVIDLKHYQEMEKSLNLHGEYKNTVEVRKLTDIYDYDAQEEMADIVLMRSIVQKAFDENHAYISDLLLNHLKTEEEKFYDLIIPMEESAEILLPYYGF